MMRDRLRYALNSTSESRVLPTVIIVFGLAVISGVAVVNSPLLAAAIGVGGVSAGFWTVEKRKQARRQKISR